MKKFRRFATALALSALPLAVSRPAACQEPTPHLLQDAAAGKLRPAKLTMPDGTTKTMPFFSTGTLIAIEEQLKFSAVQAAESIAAPTGVSIGLADLSQSGGTIGCSERTAGDTSSRRVNQDCSFRRQAEEKIVFNPAQPDNLLAGQNDSRMGFNQCGISFSTDNGLHWGDLLPPFRSRLNNPASLLPTGTDPNRHTIKGGAGTMHTYDAGSDPAPAFDSQGRGFFSCVAFDIQSNASLLYVVQSPLGAQGSFFLNLENDRRFLVVEDNSPEVSHDKEFIVADTYTSSPNRDNVYATWTVFNFSARCISPQNPGGFCSSPIYGSMSTNNGRTWSTPEEISGASPHCFFGNFFDPTRSPNSCDFDQGSDPAVLPNGELEFVFNNGNTAATNPNNQQLAVHCKPTGSSPAGTARLNCAAPARVGDDVIVNEPLCDFGRGPEACIPGNFVRTDDFPRIAVNKANGHLFATWQDYRNGEYDIQLASSTDGGVTWSATTTVNPDRGLDHYFPASDIAQNSGKDRVGVSYYRTHRVPNENSTPRGGFAPGQPGVQQMNSDYVLAGGTGLAAPFNFKILSPLFPPPDGIQAGFIGDYSGLTINKGEEAHPIWSDTRNIDPFAPQNGVVHDEDVFTTKTDLPDGTARPSIGQVGKL